LYLNSFGTIIKLKIYLLIFISIFIQPVFAQQSRLSVTVNQISEFIASDYFRNLHGKVNDLSLVDTLFNRALKYRNNDYSEALLSLTLAVVPYKKVPIRIPLIKTIIQYPLVSSGDSVFFNKNKNLPKELFFDTPENNFGDKDKLAHFFGSAFLAYNSSIFDLGDLIGYFVEVFEEEFKVQSEIDNRDLMTNKLGYIFGKYLKRNKNVQPSYAFLLRTLFYLSYSSF
jgi:hypothetical protein